MLSLCLLFASLSGFLCKEVWRVKRGLDLARRSSGELPTRRRDDDGSERTARVTDNVRVALVVRSCFARLLMYFGSPRARSLPLPTTVGETTEAFLLPMFHAFHYIIPFCKFILIIVLRNKD